MCSLLFLAAVVSYALGNERGAKLLLCDGPLLATLCDRGRQIFSCDGSGGGPRFHA